MNLRARISTYLTLTLLIASFLSCEKSNDSILEEEQILTSENTSNVSYNSGVAKYSSVQAPSKPNVYTTKYYPSSNTASAINAAISAANSAGGGTVQLSSGTYTINSRITMKSNVRLLGTGSGSTILRRGSGFQTSTSSYFVGADNASLDDVEVRDLTLDGDYSRSELAADPTVLVGVRLASVTGTYNTRVRVINCEIEGFTIGIQMSGTTHITVQGCDVHDNGGSYLHHNIYFRRIGHVLIYNNDIYDSVGGSGVKLAGGTTNVSNESRYFTIRNNNINNNERINLNIQGCHHILVEDNELRSQNSTVSAMAGMFLKSYNGYQCRYTDIINNSITSNANNGVYVNGCKDFSIQGNQCSSNGTNYNIISSSNFSCDYNN